jgi:hypothetical protein
MDERVSRGEMTRRLDETSAEVHELLTRPLTEDERETLSRTLERLLPLVADELQDAEDAQAAAILLRRTRGVRGRRPAASPPS